MENTFTVPAVLDTDTLLQQAQLLWELSKSTEGEEAALLMGAAAMLFHLHNGRFVLTEVREFSNREDY